MFDKVKNFCGVKFNVCSNETMYKTNKAVTNFLVRKLYF
mgnify:CR=1 FL=1